MFSYWIQIQLEERTSWEDAIDEVIEDFCVKTETEGVLHSLLFY